MKHEKIHYVYKIMCNITNKFYIGKHSCIKLPNDYYGSGKIIKASIKKYGKDNHTKVVLYILETENDAYLKEKEIITVDILSDILCMNLILGGTGGRHPEIPRSMSIETREKLRLANIGKKHTPETIEKMKRGHERNFNDEEFREKNSKRLTLLFKNKHKSEEQKRKMGEASKGKPKSEEHKLNLSGENNGAFGKIWIYNNEQQCTKLIHPEELSLYTSSGWIKGFRKRKSFSCEFCEIL